MTLKWTAHGQTRWHSLKIPKIPPPFTDLVTDISEIPGASVTVGGVNNGWFMQTVINAHESVLVLPQVTALCVGIDAALPEVIPGRATTLATLENRTPRDYQLDGAKWLFANRGGLLGDQMGLGKTTTAILAVLSYRLQVEPQAHVLIVGPKFVCDVWRRELKAVGALRDDEDFFVAEGAQPDANDERAISKATWWFCHYGLLDAWRAVFTRPLHTQRATICIIDEAHWARNPKSKRGKATAAMAQICRFRIALTGTPLANRIDDLWMLLSIVDGAGSWGGSTFPFLSRYTHYERGEYGYASHGTQREDELQSRLARSYLRRTIEDVGAELPPLTREQQLVVINAPLSTALKKYTGGDQAKGLARLREAIRTSGFSADTIAAITEWRKWTSKGKVPATADLVASILAQGESVVAFVWLRETVDALAHAVGKLLAKEDIGWGLFTVHGGKDQEERDALVSNFQQATLPTLLIATIESLKEGVTLHRARRVVIHDLDWTPSNILQAEARVHRLGQYRACVATWMVGVDSADILMAEHLVKKAQLTADVLADDRANEAMEQVDLRERVTDGAEFAARLLEGFDE
jgi:SNF2 family DNA or RNA helicase